MGEGFSGISTDRVGFVQHEKLPVGMVEADDTVGDGVDLADLHQFLCLHKTACTAGSTEDR